MATYNGAAYLREQIDSILANTYQNIIITVCDDGSTDDTMKIVNEYKTKYPDKFKIKQNSRNKGIVRNFLEAAYESPYDYIMFSDQDDVWMKEKIEKSYYRMLRMEKRFGKELPLAAYSDAIVVNERLEVLFPSFHGVSHLKVDKVDLPHLLMENKIIGCTLIFNKALKDKLEKMPLHARMHDWWVALLATSFGKVSYIKEPLLLYRQHSNNVVGNKSFTKYVWDRISKLRKQRQVLEDILEQGEEFNDFFVEELNCSGKIYMKAFVSIRHKNWFQRRRVLSEYGFHKSGFFRNIGVYLLI